MKKVYVILSTALIVLSGCAVGDQEDETKTYMIVDQDTNKVLNNYEYSADGKTLLSTKSYAEDQSVNKQIEYEYDDDGNLLMKTETVEGSSPKVITYETEEEYDSRGRLAKTIRRSSEGELLETYFGYDEAGELRGVVEQLNKGPVIMKDYKTD